MAIRVAVILCMVVLGAGGYILNAADADPDPSTIISNHLTAMGGKEAIAAVHDKTVKGTITITGMSGPITGTIETQQKSPNMAHNFIDVGVAQSETWFDGEKGYHVDPVRGSGPFTDAEVEEAKQVFVMSPFLTYQERGLKARYVGKDTVDGKEALVVELSDPKGTATTYYFDAATSKLVRSVAPSSTPGEGDRTVLFSDYREVNGLQHAFKISYSTAAMTIDVAVDSIQVNTGLDDSVFRHKE